MINSRSRWLYFSARAIAIAAATAIKAIIRNEIALIFMNASKCAAHFDPRLPSGLFGGYVVVIIANMNTNATKNILESIELKIIQREKFNSINTNLCINKLYKLKIERLGTIR